MIYSCAFFDLQLRFAQTAAILAGSSVERALLEYTNLYIRFGLGRDIDPDHVSWRAYLDGLSKSDDARGWTYQFYLESLDGAIRHPVVATFGCFSYALLAGGRIKLHFENSESEANSPLAIGRVEHRRSDLRDLFREVCESSHPPQSVVGASWLYNLEAYRRLFPPAYLATAQTIGPNFQRMSLWGQLLDRFGKTKDSPTRSFIERVEHASTPEDLSKCFALQTLMVEAPLSEFRDFYEI